MFKTTQYKGVIGQTAGSTIIGEAFERAFGDWLSDALQIPRTQVEAGWRTQRDRFPDCVDYAVFFLGPPRQRGMREEGTDGTELVVHYFGDLEINVVIYGENARLLSMLLCDLFSIDQNSNELHEKCGLGYVQSSITAQLMEPVGSDYRQRADVTLQFNYRYDRTWAVRSLVEAPDVSYKSEV